MTDRLKEIKERLEARPGQENFDPAYMYKNPHADVTFLLTELEKVTAERDLAIAHDRQPYPTAHAYEQVCKTVDRLKAGLERATVERDEWSKRAWRYRRKYRSNKALKAHAMMRRDNLREALEFAKGVIKTMPPFTDQQFVSVCLAEIERICGKE